MELREADYVEGRIRAENVGGIQEASVEFSPGVTILVGRNATNRTSFLRSVMAALGSDDVAIKGDADEAEVELTLGEETFTRRLRRTPDGVVGDGEPLLDDPALADLFAFLLESNEARRAVATDQDLRDIIMRPIDAEAIQAEIDLLVRERESLEEELAEIEDLKADLPDLEEKRRNLKTQIEEKKEGLEAKEAELEAADGTIEETQEETSKLEDKLDELRSKRSQLDDTRYDLETERESLESLNKERQELEIARDDLPETPVGDIEEIDDTIRRLRQQKQQLEADVNEVQSVIGFNEEMLEDARSSTFAEVTETESDEVTDRLLEGDEVSCWTCGSTVDREQIESTVSRLRELSQEKVGDVSNVENEIEELREEKREIERARTERDRIERRLSDIESEIERTRDAIGQLQDTRDELTEEIESVEAEVEELENEDYGDIIDIHKEANQLEYELGKLETNLDRVEEDIADIEERIALQDDLEAQMEEINAEIEELRMKIERIEQDAIEQFNEHMDTVLEILDYANLDRIWLERTRRDVKQGRRTVTKSAFELHVVRTSDSGTAYEDTVDHLSESEREVTGLVFALAGYLAHDVYEDTPIMLLDSLEAIDSERIASLVEYLTDYTGFLLVALLPEDAGALPHEYDRITEI